jgi:hypothetical protein
MWCFLIVGAKVYGRHIDADVCSWKIELLMVGNEADWAPRDRRRVGAAAQKLRKSRRMIRETLADRSDLELVFIAAIETGRRRAICPGEAEALVDALQIQIRDFFPEPQGSRRRSRRISRAVKIRDPFAKR